MKVSYETV